MVEISPRLQSVAHAPNVLNLPATGGARNRPSLLCMFVFFFGVAGFKSIERIAA